MNNPQQHAYDLYFNSNLTQKRIAELAGVSTRTLYEWMKQGNWKTLKATSRYMPAQIVDDLYHHISHLNFNIKSRDFEARYPSREEAETLRKLIFSVNKVKAQASKGETAQSMINFVSWLQHQNNDAAIFISDYIDQYLHAGRKQGLEPYEFEYDADSYYNPEDFPWRTQATYQEQFTDWYQNTTQQENPLAHNTSSPSERPGEVTLTQEETPPSTAASPASSAGGDSPTSTNVEHGQGDVAPSPAPKPNQELRNIQPNVTPSPLVEKGPGDEVNKNQSGSKQEVPPPPLNPTKPLDNQTTNPSPPPQLTSENKKSEIGDSDSGGTGDPDKPKTKEEVEEYVQQVFESWRKMIEKNKRKRQY